MIKTEHVPKEQFKPLFKKKGKKRQSISGWKQLAAAVLIVKNNMKSDH